VVGCDALTSYRVLFHLDEGSAFRLKLTLSNIRNLFADFEVVEVECVVNGAGVKLFQTPTANELEVIKTLAGRGVCFLVCQHSLAVYGLSKESMLEVVDFVPSGVGELVKKQAEGWAYIKP